MNRGEERGGEERRGGLNVKFLEGLIDGKMSGRSMDSMDKMY